MIERNSKGMGGSFKVMKTSKSRPALVLPFYETWSYEYLPEYITYLIVHRISSLSLLDIQSSHRHVWLVSVAWGKCVSPVLAQYFRHVPHDQPLELPWSCQTICFQTDGQFSPNHTSGTSFYINQIRTRVMRMPIPLKFAQGSAPVTVSRKVSTLSDMLNIAGQRAHNRSQKW